MLDSAPPTIITVAIALAGFVTACFKWLASRDDRREEERNKERSEFCQALAAQQASCKHELQGLVDSFRAERELDRQAMRELIDKVVGH